MSLTLDAFAARVREILAREDTPRSRAQVAELLGAALANSDFVQAQFATEVSQRRVLHEDPQYGFCILAHEFLGARASGPHDHGPSWAIYGQAAGETIMTDFEVLHPASIDRPGSVRSVRTYTMKKGDVHVYNEQDVHAPRRTDSTRLIRIEGRNLEGVARLNFDIVEG